MQIKLVVILFLGFATLSTGGFIKEKHFHKAIDVLTPMIPVPVVGGIVNKVAKQMVHKIGKLDTPCIFGIDKKGNCEKTCQETTHQKGYCHGTKCKCGKPLNYK
uniref:Putative scorpine-like peptide n=1 Tax=Superstitionia donensis TaxID=311983 RepID=A0A1V1WBN9_9SCOR